MTLLNLARQGDSDAWNRISDTYAPFVFSQIVRRGLSKTDAEDVTQEVFIAVHKGLGAFRKDDSSHGFMNWLRSITSNKIVDWYRKSKDTEIASGGTAAHASLEQAPFADENWETSEYKNQIFLRAMELMKTDFEEKTWMAFWLTHVQQLETREICEQLDMSQGAVRQSRSKVRK